MTPAAMVLTLVVDMQLEEWRDHERERAVTWWQDLAVMAVGAHRATWADMIASAGSGPG